jgi:hypothetical protein
MPSDAKLSSFVDWCQKHIIGDEKGQAQIFLDRLFQAFDHPGVFEAGGQTEFRIRKSDEDGGGTAFADLVWKPVVLIEMKKRGEPLQKHYRQAFDYWTCLVPNRPRYVVLCNFDEFWIYDFETDIDTPKDKLALAELPARWGPLAFLANQRPTFENDREAVTREAADKLAECFSHIVKRDIDRAIAQKFILQMLVALFSEDIGLLPKYFVTQVLEDCHSPADSFDLIGGLFEAMNDPKPKSGGRFKGVSYFNGGLFAQPAKLELLDRELVLLRKAAGYNWSKVQPEIFGTLFQHSMDAEERHAFGAHYTHPADIMKIVGPTIVEPWREQIEGAKTRARLNELLHRMHEYRVLDPACGSGNFLYIAYRELKRLEARIYERLKTEFKRDAKTSDQMPLSFLSAQNFYGIDILPFAVEIAKVTMMIARKLAIDELHITEQALPLDNLDKNFIVADALLTSEGLPREWPKSDVVIGNPPFLDARKMTQEYGREYVSRLEKNYPEVPRRADLCTYWIRRANDHISLTSPNDRLGGRAGLVGTQNIRNNESREGGLDYVTDSGSIIEAVENQPWSGEANVNVSIVNWTKTKDSTLLPKERRLWFKRSNSSQIKKHAKTSDIPAHKAYEIDVRLVGFISSSLSDQTDVSKARVLEINRDPKRCFEGQQPGHEGFRVPKAEAQELIETESNEAIVFQYMNGVDLLTNAFQTEPSYIIDFAKRDILQASAFPKALNIIRERVLPDWEKNATAENSETGKGSGEHQGRLETWWQLKRRRHELIALIEKIPRYLVCSRVTKRPIFTFLDSKIHPDSSLTCFGFADNYSFGILQSQAHWLWFTTKCSKLTERFRYTPDSVFDTFPWPQNPKRAEVIKVAKAAQDLTSVRTNASRSVAGGLRALYRTLELPGSNPLRDAHAALDAAVLETYGFNPKKDLLAQLLALNLEVAARIERNEPVTAPGIPPNFSNPQSLITTDCIQPAPL